MTDWERLGSYVVHRRVELGYKSRGALVDAALGVGLRTLGDVETGRRKIYRPNTIAALETALRWTPGSINAVLAGGEPTEDPTPRHFHRTLTDNAGGSDTINTVRSDAGSRRDEALIQVMRSDQLSDDDKAKIVRLLIAERQAFERGRATRAQELIELFDGS